MRFLYRSALSGQQRSLSTVIGALFTMTGL